MEEKTIRIERYTADRQKQWDDFVNASRTPMFMFNRGFMDYHSDRFTDYSLMFYSDDELIAVMPASEHGDEVRSHGGLTYGGMICSASVKQHTAIACFDALCDFCRLQGKTSVLYKSIPYIYHVVPGEEDMYALFRLNAATAKIEPSTVIDLAHPCKMPKGRKAQVSRARREGVVVQETDDFEAFVELENSVLAARHNQHAVHTAVELRLLKSRFPERVRCVGGFLNGRMIAGTVLFVYDAVVHTQYLAADDEACRIGALDLVVSEQIAKYTPTHRYFDFGISSEEGGTVLNHGLISQKEGFGGRTVVYRTYRLNV